MAQDILTEAVPARLYTEGSGLNLARAALFGVGLDKVRDIVELLRLYRGGKPNSLIMGGPMGWSWYATLDADHHGALTGPANAHRHGDLANIGIDDHHARDHATRHHSGGADALALGSIAGNLTDAQHGSRSVANAHAHGHLSGIGVNDHHARDHVLATGTGLGATHTISGAAAGQVLRASSASAANFQQLAHGDLGGVGINDHHARDHAASHLIGGADPLSVGAPVNIGTANAEGSATNFARRDHVHNHPSGLGANLHHNQSHVLATNTGLGADHTMSGAAAGQVLRASSATAANFQQLAHGDLGGIGINDHHARDHASTHLVGGADALSVGTPVAIGASDAAGSATNFVRRDHVHAHSTTRRCDGNFSGATDFRIETRTSDPASPADGRMWLRTDL